MLTPRVSAPALAFRQRLDRPAAADAQRSKISDAEMVGEFLIHIAASAATPPVAATRGWPPSGPSSGSWPCERADLLHCRKILAMPGKRHVRRTVEFLDRPGIEALLAARIARRGSAVANSRPAPVRRSSQAVPL